MRQWTLKGLGWAVLGNLSSDQMVIELAEVSYLYQF